MYLAGLGSVPFLDGGTLLAIQRLYLGAMTDASMPYQAGTDVCWQERQQWGDNPQWYARCEPIPAQYLGPVYIGGSGTVTPSPTVPDGVVRTQPVSKPVDGGGTVVTQVPKPAPVTPGAPFPPPGGGAPFPPPGGGGGYDIIGGVTGELMPGGSTPAPAASPIPWGLIIAAGLAVAGA
jgi:hypothetical protein